MYSWLWAALQSSPEADVYPQAGLPSALDESSHHMLRLQSAAKNFWQVYSNPQIANLAHGLSFLSSKSIGWLVLVKVFSDWTTCYLSLIYIMFNFIRLELMQPWQAKHLYLAWPKKAEVHMFSKSNSCWAAVIMTHAQLCLLARSRHVKKIKQLRVAIEIAGCCPETAVPVYDLASQVHMCRIQAQAQVYIYI